MPIPLIGGALSAIGSIFKKKSTLTSTRPTLLASTRLEEASQKKPGLFARLFNTKKNQEYNAQIQTAIQEEEVAQEMQQQNASRLSIAGSKVGTILLYVAGAFVVIVLGLFAFGRKGKR